MDYKQVDTHIWDDEYIYDLTDQELSLFIFYFTNEKVDMTGIYEMPDRKVLYYRKNMTNEILQTIKTKFENDKKYYFHDSWIYIANNHKNNQFSTNMYVVKKFVADFNSIPVAIRKYYFETKGLEYIPPFNLKKIKHSLSIEKEMVIEIEKEKEKEKENSEGGSLPTSLVPSLGNEDVDPKSIPF